MKPDLQLISFLAFGLSTFALGFSIALISVALNGGGL